MRALVWLLSRPFSFCFRLLFAGLFLAFWLLMLPLWFFLVFRLMLGVVWASVVSVWRGGGLQGSERLDAALNMWPRGLDIVDQLFMGRWRDVAPPARPGSIAETLLEWALSAFLLFWFVYWLEMMRWVVPWINGPFRWLWDQLAWFVRALWAQYGMG